MQNIDELVQIISKQISSDNLIINCSKEFLNQLGKEIEEDKFHKDVENFLSVVLKSIDGEIIECLSTFYKKHIEDFNSKEAQKYFINIVKNSTIYGTVNDNFLDFFSNYLKDNPTNEIRKKGFNKTLEESKIIINNCTFNDYDEYHNVLNKLSNIAFKNCTFEEDSYNFLIANKDCELKFLKCTFEGQWEYIESKKTLYSDCIFDIYRHYNIEEIKEVVENLLFYNCIFKKIRCEGIYFKDQIFKNNNLYKNLQFEEVSFIRCEFDKKFLVTYNKLEENSNTLFNIKKLDLTDSIFHSKVELKEINFSRISIFNNTKFNELCDFYGSVFNNFICFTKTTFKDISVFTNVSFKNNIDFKYTTFEKLAQFKETVFEKSLNLEDTIIKEEINFLKIKTKDKKEITSKNIANRETARIIKDSFEQQSNIIEANKFYTLEMKEREKELDNDIKKRKNTFEWLVFKIHSIASNHSQDWTLALFWIINLTFFYSFLKISIQNYFELSTIMKIIFSCIAISVIACMTIKIPQNYERRWLTTIPITIVCYVFYGYLVENDWHLSEFSKNLNPFSIMRGDEPIALGTLIFKIIIAYLIYQLIISIRQNTRRK